MIRAVLFDIDGTLIRTHGAGVKALDRAFAMEFGLTDALGGLSIAGRTDTSVLRQCLAKHHRTASAEEMQRFFDIYTFLLRENLERIGGRACLGAREFIHELQSLPDAPALGLLTGNIRLGAEIKLRHFDLWKYFEFGAFGDDHEDRNYLAALAKQRVEGLLGVHLEGSEVLVVGDTPLDVHCANAIGAHVLAVGTGEYTCDDLRCYEPTWLVDDLRQLKAAHVCGGDPSVRVRNAAAAAATSAARLPARSF